MSAHKFPESMTEPGWVILGPYGNLWTHRLFETVDQARDFIEERRPAQSKPSEFRVVRGTSTIAVTPNLTAETVFEAPA